MAQKTLGLIATMVRDRLDELVPAFWTEEQIRRWINEGCQDIARRSQTLQTSSTISAVAGTQSYTLPATVLQVNRIEYKRTGDSNVYALEFRENNTMDPIWFLGKTIHRATPTYYTTWGYPPTVTMLLYPTPDAAGTITVYYYKQATQLATDGSADSSSVDIPQGWEDLLIDYAEYSALRKDGDPTWKDAKSIYEQKLDEFIKLTRQWSDQETFMSNVGAGGGAMGWLYGGGY